MNTNDHTRAKNALKNLSFAALLVTLANYLEPQTLQLVGSRRLRSVAEASEISAIDDHAEKLNADIERIRYLLSGITAATDEREIIDILGRQTSEDLNATLTTIPFDEILSDIDDHLWGQQNLHTFLDLLFNARANDLKMATKLAMVNALQTGPTNDREEEAISRILLSSHGKDLTDLKIGIDLGKDHRTLHELIYVDVDNEIYREAILNHIAAEGASLGNVGVKVLSDIDDTIYASLHDESFPKDSLYPGVRELYKQLGNLTFLTARPFTRIGYYEAETHQLLDRMEFIERSLLMGSLSALLTPELMGRKKALNFNIYEKLFPEFRFIFFGDSGQGDILTATLIQKSHLERVSSALIHDIRIDGALGNPKISMTERTAHSSSTVAPIFIYDTYVGAATRLFTQGLLSKEQLRLVMTAAGKDLEAISFENDSVKVARQAELAADLAHATSLIEPN